MAITGNSDRDHTTPKEAHLKEKEEKEKSDASKDVPDSSSDPSVLKDNGTDRVLKILTITDNRYIDEAEEEDSIKAGVTETDIFAEKSDDDDNLQVSLPNEKEDDNTTTSQPQQCELSVSLSSEKEPTSCTITTQPQQCELSVSLSSEKEPTSCTITTQPQQQTGKQQVSDFVDEDQQGWSKADLEANCEKSDKDGEEENCSPLTNWSDSTDPWAVAKLLLTQYPEVILHLMSDGVLEKDSTNSSESQDKEKTEDLKETDLDKDVEEESEKIDTFADENSASSCHDNSTEDVEENEAVFEKDTEEALEKTMKGTKG
uniref:Uncharacterized protein n=1 Tax=Branchiostoma floridae TaxID=7739 RepID=C3ZH59_BRAFL|eukprot:XP_002592195.1 hypothetical protein BRAFLDRAFT_84621 [Branchiostoma floridae]